MNEALQNPRSIREIIVDLSKPLDPAHLKTRKQGGAQITYIEWHTAVRYLDLFAPGWSYHVKSVTLVGDLVTVIASISIPCAEGIVTREATGCEEADAKGYGDACSNSEAMALKRAAAKFGLGLSLYQKGDSQPIASAKSNGRQTGADSESAAAERVRLAKEKAGLQASLQLQRQGKPAITIDAAPGGDYEKIGELLIACGIEDSSGNRRFVYNQLAARGDFEGMAKYLSQTTDYMNKTFGHLSVTADTGPSRDLMQNPKYSKETGKRLGAVCTRLVAHGVSGEELLREVNFGLTSFGKDPVESRYELDDESALQIVESFNQWADSLDRKAKAGV